MTVTGRVKLSMARQVVSAYPSIFQSASTAGVCAFAPTKNTAEACSDPKTKNRPTKLQMVLQRRFSFLCIDVVRLTLHSFSLDQSESDTEEKSYLR